MVYFYGSKGIFGVCLVCSISSQSNLWCGEHGILIVFHFNYLADWAQLCDYYFVIAILKDGWQ